MADQEKIGGILTGMGSVDRQPGCVYESKPVEEVGCQPHGGGEGFINGLMWAKTTLLCKR